MVRQELSECGKSVISPPLLHGLLSFAMVKLALGMLNYHEASSGCV